MASGDGNRPWYGAYLGFAYRTAVTRALEAVDDPVATILKADLWNEALGGGRDILDHLSTTRDCRCVGVDLSLRVCADARARSTRIRVVQADIRALPFRPEGVDAVLDLSTLDHLSEGDALHAVGEYRRVLRDRGALLIVFWQRNAAVRLRLALKRWLGRREKPGQHYLPRSLVLDAFGDDLVVCQRFVAGSVLVAPYGVLDFLLHGLSTAVVTVLVRWLVTLERFAPLQPLLAPIAGLYGVVGRRRRTAAAPSGGTEVPRGGEPPQRVAAADDPNGSRPPGATRRRKAS